jgi:hypothetical protein
VRKALTKPSGVRGSPNWPGGAGPTRTHYTADLDSAPHRHSKDGERGGKQQAAEPAAHASDRGTPPQQRVNGRAAITSHPTCGEG